MEPGSNVIRWCESCQRNEALLRVTEQIEGEADYVHQWCIECAKLRVIDGVDTDLAGTVYLNE